MKRVSITTRWVIPVIMLLLALVLVACERPLQEAPAATEAPTTTQPEEQPDVPAPPTPALPEGGELPPIDSEGGDTETPAEGEPPPDAGEGSAEEGTDAPAGEGETPAEGDTGETPTEGLAEDGTYTVKAGDTLYKIATAHGVTVDELAQANGITNVNFIDVGDVLTIPSASGAGEEAAEGGEEVDAGDDGDDATTGEEQTYIVKPGDILGTIAQQFGFTIAEIAAYNEMDANTTLYVGDEIRIPPSGWTIPEQ